MAAPKSIAEKRGQLEDLRAGITAVDSSLVEVQAQIDRLYRKKQALQKEKDKLAAEAKHLEKACSQPDVNLKRSDFSWSERLHSLKKSKFGISAFRPYQEEVINATMSGRDIILVMPTGGGKSLCFQLPALLTEGFTLVVSPLVSLMEDQAMSLQESDIPATLLSAATSRDHVKSVHRDMVQPGGSGLKLLYVTPEKIAKSKRFMAQLQKAYEKGRLSRIAIDEVHCCSQWGHDFRPDYKVLGILKRQFPRSPILGLTATASTGVLEDVKSILGIPGCDVFRASYNRANLYYEVRPKPATGKDFITTLEKMIKGEFASQSGIIYCFSRKDTETLAEELRQRGILAAAYHAHVEPAQRSQVHRNWKNGHIQVVIATTAFGMGIDKPDVRFVIHHSLSKSMENYYQESGRAGRIDQPAKCILFFGFVDVFRQSTMVVMEQTGLEKLYKMVAYCISTTRCRRELLGEHFDGAMWQEGVECDGMCDTCGHGSSDEERDVTSITKQILRIIWESSNKEQRLTGLKLIDLLGKSHNSKETEKLSKTEYGHIILHLLLEGYLKEDFHFTAYSTISYMCPGPKADHAQSGSVITIPAWSPKRTSAKGDGGKSGRKGKPCTAVPKTPRGKPQKTSALPKEDDIIILDDESETESDLVEHLKQRPQSHHTGAVGAGTDLVASQEVNGSTQRSQVRTLNDDNVFRGSKGTSSTPKRTNVAKNKKAPRSSLKTAIKVDRNGTTTGKTAFPEMVTPFKGTLENDERSSTTPKQEILSKKSRKGTQRKKGALRDSGDVKELVQRPIKQKRKLNDDVSGDATSKRSKQNQSAPGKDKRSEAEASSDSCQSSMGGSSNAASSTSLRPESGIGGNEIGQCSDKTNNSLRETGHVQKGRHGGRTGIARSNEKRTKLACKSLSRNGKGKIHEKMTGSKGGEKNREATPSRTTPGNKSPNEMDTSNVSDSADIASVYMEQLSSLEHGNDSDDENIPGQDLPREEIRTGNKVDGSCNLSRTAETHHPKNDSHAVTSSKRTRHKYSPLNPSASSGDEEGLGIDGESVSIPASEASNNMRCPAYDVEDDDRVPRDEWEMDELATIYSEQLSSLGE